MSLSLGCTRRSKPLVLLAWTAAVAIAWSRVHLGVHFPSDVMAGALVGCASALLVWNLAWRLRRGRHLRLAPRLKQLRFARLRG
jgi:undecaprenyl-diphosphatase